MAEFGEIMIHGTFGDKKVRPMARGFYEHIYLHHGIDRITISIQKVKNNDKLLLNGQLFANNGLSNDLGLAVGKNTYIAEIQADDDTASQAELNIFRAYPTPTWEQILEHAPWCPRDSAGELVFHNQMWLFGGYVPETVNDVWSSYDGVNWTKHADCPAENGIDIPVTFIYNEKMYLIGLDNVLWATSDGENWEEICRNAPWKDHCHRITGGVFQNKIWLFEAGEKRGIWSSPDGGYTWKEELKHTPWSMRDIDSTMLVYDNKVWIIGGSSGRAGSYFPFIAYSDVWCSEDGIHWECVTRKAPWPKRMWQSTFVYKNRMWIAAGYHSEPESRHFGDVWYSIDGKNWREFRQHAAEWKPRDLTLEDLTPLSIPAPMWSERHETSVLVKDDAVYLMGGMEWPLKNDVWKLKIDGFCFLTQPVFECCTGILYEYYAFADFSDSRLDAKYRLVQAPENLTVEEDTGRVSGIIETAGNYEIILEAFTDVGETVRQKYNLDIMNQC